MNHPVFKILLSLIFVGAATLLAFFYHIGGEYWYISLFIGVAIVVYLGYLLNKEKAELSEFEDFIKFFRAGQTDMITELLKKRRHAEVVADLKIACLEYIQNVYINRVRHVLKTFSLTHLEAAYLEQIIMCLEGIEQAPESEIDDVFDTFYNLNFDLLQYLCECDEAQECLDTGEKINRFLSKYHFES